MNKKSNKNLLLATCGLLLSALSSCGDNSSNEVNKDKYSKFESISYESIEEISEISKWQGEVKKDGNNNDDPVDNGLVKCQFYTLKINDIDVPVYSTRCALGTHSYAWIDVESAENVYLDVKLNMKNKHDRVVVLPESNGIEASLNGKEVSAVLNKLGSFSFAFDRKVDEALTIFVALKEESVVPTGYEKVIIEPGRYHLGDTSFENTKTLYYFKKGNYELSSIVIPNESKVYFEPGTYIYVTPEDNKDNHAAIESFGTSDIEVYGRALFDFSACQGGDAKVKGVFNFINIDKARFTGVVSINSNNWSLCFTNSNDVVVEGNMLLGYRTYSDGIMMSDCQDCLIRNNFVRTGDDAIEVKSTGSEGTSNMIYEYNAVWTDKARGYGCIYESNKNVKNVVFRNNSIGFALPTWSPILGCCTINMGTRRATIWEDVYFKDIEVYIAYNALINISLRDDTGNGVDGGTCKNIYFQNITAYRAYGYAVSVTVHRGSTLGKIYIDNLKYNDKDFKPSDLNNENEVNVSHYNSSWSKTSNIKVNSLSESE